MQSSHGEPGHGEPGHGAPGHGKSAKKPLRSRRTIGIAGLMLAGIAGLTLTGITTASAASTDVIQAPTAENPTFHTVGHSDPAKDDDERTHASNLAHANNLAALPASDLCEAAGYPHGIDPIIVDVTDEPDHSVTVSYIGICLPRE